MSETRDENNTSAPLIQTFASVTVTVSRIPGDADSAERRQVVDMKSSLSAGSDHISGRVRLVSSPIPDSPV